MAKGNMLLGQARGSVGDITFSRVNGKQVIKAKAGDVKNPQTTSQLIQRILMNTISQAYSKMQDICDHSFEGVAAGQMSMSYFMQKNLNLLRYTLSQVGDLNASAPCFAPIGNNGLASNSYVIAKGSLPEIYPQVSSGAIAIDADANTYAAILAATGLQRGDQLTLITVSGDDLSDQVFTYSRIILDPRDENGNELGLETPFVEEGVINAANSRNENRGHVYAFDAGSFEVGVNHDVINMGAAIASRQKADGSWLRSNAALLLAEGAQIGYSMQQALDLFASGGIDVESAKYLNNALRKVRAASTSVDNGGNTSPAVAAPTISGTTPFTDNTQVTISADQGATIYYTTDGSVPTTASTQYSAPFTLSATTTVKAIAKIEGSISTVATKTFTKGSGGGGGDDDENT